MGSLEEGNKRMPKVGVAVIIEKGDGVLIGKRKGKHGDEKWAPPGGKLEMWEDIEECGKREVREETSIDVGEMEFIGITNDLFKEEGEHYVTIFLKAKDYSGEPRVMEPEKCEKWEWVSWKELERRELFLSFRNFLNSKTYKI